MKGGAQQARLVAVREMRQRSRSRSFQAALVVMLVLVVGMIAVPATIDTTGRTRDVGLTGAFPDQLPQAIRDQGDAVDTTIRIHAYGDVAAGRDAVRHGDADVLVVDARRLEWQGAPDEELETVITGAIQLIAIEQRAKDAGVDPEDVLALVAPVPVENVEIGLTPGRGPTDSTAAIVMTVLLLIAIITYGNLVLTGVVEEKASRVVEVLLARMPARNLLAGKVAGIGALGFAQFVLTALAALVAALFVDEVDIPAVRGSVLAWVVVWFVLGYALYAMAYGALGSLASRVEDASSVAGPVSYLLIAAYWASFIAVSADPNSAWSRLLSYFPATAPLAMPGRIALGAAAWWEAVLAVVLTMAAIAGLVILAGRVYTNAILRTGPRLRLREAWRSAHGPTPWTSAGGAPPSGQPTEGPTPHAGEHKSGGGGIRTRG
jgi:ABC-2 type transport system permease protein